MRTSRDFSIRDDLGKWFQDKSPLGNARVRQLEAGLFDHHVVTIKEVEVQCSWGVDRPSIRPMVGAFNFLQFVQKVKGIPAEADLHGRIEKARRTGGATHRNGLVEFGNEDRGDGKLSDVRDCGFQVGASITQV